MTSTDQQTRTGLLFINKSASHASLSHSEAEEGLNIRRFIQLRNRRIERARKQALHTSHSREHTLRSDVKGDCEYSSRIVVSTAEISDSSGQPMYVDATKHSRNRGSSSTNTCGQQLPDLPSTEPSHYKSARREVQQVTGICNSISLRKYWSPAECRGAEYFMRLIAARFTSTECLAFWNIFLPCVLEEDLGVRLLVTGLSLMHEFHDPREHDAERARFRYGQALATCNNAMEQIRRAAVTMSRISLDMTCILIVSFEMLAGNLAAAEACLDSGLKMAKTSKAKIVRSRWQQPILPSNLTSCQRAIEVTQAKMSGAFHVFAVKPESHDPRSKYRPELPSLSTHVPFSNFEDVNTLAEMLYSATLRVLENASKELGIDRKSATARAILDGFESFHHGLKLIRIRTSSSMPTSEAVPQAVIPEIKVLEAQVVFNCVILDDDEMSFDGWSWAFDRILGVLADKLEASTSEPSRLTFHPFSAVFVTPLWLTASRCREPDLRRQAIHLLRRYRRRETVFDSLIAANLAEQIMRKEEDSEVKIESCRDIRPAQRFKLVDVEYLSMQDCIRLDLAQKFEALDGSKVTIQESMVLKVPEQWHKGDCAMSMSTLLRPLLLYS